MKAASYTYAQENVLVAQYGSGNGVSTYGQLAGQMHSDHGSERRLQRAVAVRGELGEL